MIIGFIGLGIMGRPIAENLIKAGYKLIVYDQFAKFDDLVSMGAERAVSNKEAASGSEIIITVLPNSLQVKETILGIGGVVEGLKKGSIVIDMSSIAQDLSNEVILALKKKNAAFLDVQVSGGKAGAIHGTLSMFVKGDKNHYTKVRPILEKTASHIEFIDRK